MDTNMDQEIKFTRSSAILFILRATNMRLTDSKIAFVPCYRGSLN